MIMKTLHEIQKELRHFHKKDYLLLSACNFFSVLLITAYVTMMRSPTVLSVLPEGGDSRKQVMAVFLLTMIGCCVFVAYTAALFFKYKSREVGIMMALGASKKALEKQLYAELAEISLFSCVLGAILGSPLAFGIWKIFEQMIKESAEMKFVFSAQAYLYSASFTVFTVGMLLLMGRRFIRQSNIIDVVNSQRKSEPVKDVKPWYGVGGIGLMIFGGVFGYAFPGICINNLQWYPPEWLNALLYAPLIIGLYLVLLYTVVRGWKHGKNRYKDLIPRSMMKFQGRQTVNNMLVITVLVAGAYFASFYAPMLTTGSSISLETRPIDYQFHYRQDEDMPQKNEIEALAKEHQVTILDYQESEIATLVRDGYQEVNESSGKYHMDYYEKLAEGSYLSESVYEKIAKESIEVEQGTFRPVYATDGEGAYMVPDDTTLLTNPITEKQLSVARGEELCCDMLFQFYVLNDADYADIAAGLTPEWKETLVDFNVENPEECYEFGDALYNQIVDRTSKDCLIAGYYDRIGKANAEAAGEVYWGDTEDAGKIVSEMRDASEFRIYWKYMPMFRIQELNDMHKTLAVFLMLFIFIAVICFAAVFVIAYTRCMTVALNNQQMYEDLRHLGAGRGYLYASIKSQIAKIFKTPVFVGTTMMALLYLVIMYGNSGSLTSGEWAGIRNCMILIVVMTAGIWGFYRLVLRQVCRILHI